MTERQASLLRKARRKLAACQDLLKDEHLEDAVSRENSLGTRPGFAKTLPNPAITAEWLRN